MATLLLIVIYVGYISLGVPDSLFGAAWPAIVEAFDLPVSYGGFISLVCSVCTFLSSLFSARLILRFGTYRITLFSTAMTAAALLLMSAVPSFPLLLLLCIPLGLGAGAIDSALNGYVALHYSAKQMNFLHCFYGVGVTLSPMIVSSALRFFSFEAGFLGVGLLQLIIALLLAASFPLWKRTAEGDSEESVGEVLSLPQMFRTRGVCGFWVLFFASCALEFTVGTWSASYLCGTRALSAAEGAGLVTLYYAGIALGRFSSGLLVGRMGAKRMILFSAVMIPSALLLLFLPLSGLFCAAVLFLIGFFNGPIYPNLMYLTPVLFGRERAQSLMGSFLAAACLGIMLAPPLFGLVASLFSLSAFVFFAFGVFALFLVALPFSGLFHAKRGAEKDST